MYLCRYKSCTNNGVSYSIQLVFKEKSYCHRITFEGVLKLEGLLPIFTVDLMYLCRCQLCIDVDIRCNFKSVYEKIMFSWNNTSDLIIGFKRGKFLIDLINFFRDQLYAYVDLR